MPPPNTVKNAYSDSAWQLMVAAERLFGRRGIENVSLREIATAAGHANNSAVQYHFGTKERLVQAVFEMRLPALDAARRKHIDAAKEAGDVGLRDLLNALLLPVLEQYEGQSLENFALFATRLAHRNASDHPFFRAADIAPVSLEIYRRIEAHFTHMPREAFEIRLRLAIDLFLDAIAEYKRMNQTGDEDSYASEAHFWGDILDLVMAVFEAPFRRAEKR